MRTATSTSSRPCLTRTGPDPESCSARWPQPSPWRSLPPTPPRSPRSGWAKPAWQPSYAATPTAAARPPSTYWPACTPPHRTGRDSRTNPHHDDQRTGASAAGDTAEHQAHRAADQTAPGRASPGTTTRRLTRRRPSQPGSTARRGRTHPQPRRHRRTSRRGMRHHTGDQVIRQDPRRLFPMGSQHPSPHRHHRVRSQCPHAIPLGRQAARFRASGSSAIYAVSCSRRTLSTVPAFCITHTSRPLVSGHLFPSPMWTAFPSSLARA